jgi:murein DD-endopeptidase MepM/ murein hydrolase activator NlpD
LHTTLPNRARFEITQYEVQKGDSIFGIAEKFGLKPQTLLWGNFDTLADDPHRLQPGQMLNILPVNGVLYEWHAGDGLNGVANFFGVTPEVILDWPGNNLARETVGDLSAPNIAVGTKLLIPGGERPFISWSAPLISRKDPAKAKIFGAGFCGTVVDGYVGAGTFVWPSSETYLSGYDYTPGTNHWGIDIAGAMGNPIYATDSGVVVYAGWNDWGYGNVIVIDHGNGWQSLYSHLSELYVGCGASVSQGATIAGMGSTGRSSGPHLHFELMNASGVRVNPWDFLTR